MGHYNARDLLKYETYARLCVGTFYSNTRFCAKMGSDHARFCAGTALCWPDTGMFYKRSSLVPGWIVMLDCVVPICTIVHGVYGCMGYTCVCVSCWHGLYQRGLQKETALCGLEIIMHGFVPACVVIMHSFVLEGLQKCTVLYRNNARMCARAPFVGL